MSMITFTIPGTPIPKGRPRSFIRGGKIGVYTPKRTADYERAIQMIASVAMKGREPISGAVTVEMVATFAIPSSWPKKRRDEAAGNPHTTKPDADNLVKAIADACNGIVWVDDSQICRLTVEKQYGMTPRVEVAIERMLP